LIVSNLMTFAISLDCTISMLSTAFADIMKQRKSIFGGMMNYVLRMLVFVTLSFSAHYANAGLGINLGIGLPFVQQYGLDYKMSDKFSAEVLVNGLDLSLGEAGVEMSKTEIGLKYHPFGGAFFLGLAYGNFNTTATATQSGNQVEAKVEGSALTTKLGWMWGVANDGFYFGMDIGYQSPMGTSTDIDAGGVPTSSEEYQDAKEAAEKYGESGTVNLTFFRIGYLF